MTDRWTLAVDLGTSRCVGAVNVGGSVSIVEVDGGRWTPSAVGIDPDGQLVVGARAEDLGRLHPDRCERTPKRHVGSIAPLLVGGVAVDLPSALGALLGRYRDEATLRNGGGGPVVTVLTHPVRWGDERTAVLLAAAEQANLPQPTLLPEPVAAAIHYADDRVEPGGFVAVFDLGGGTFDAAVLRRTVEGFDPVGIPGGLDELGGEVFDYLLYGYFGEVLAADVPEVWEALSTSEDRRMRKAAADLIDEARKAKEALSSYTSTQVFVPEADRDVVVTRTRFEELIRPDVERAIDELDRTVASAGLGPKDLAAVYLVGGSSRIPLVGRLLGERYGDRVMSRDEPKSVVALGAARSTKLLFERPAAPTVTATPTATAAPTATTAPVGVEPGGATGVSWSVTLAGNPVEPFVDSTVALLCSSAGDLTAVALDTGTQRWATRVNGAPGVAPVSDGAVGVVVDRTGNVTAFDVTSGRAFWNATLQVPCWSPPAMLGDFVFVGTDGSEFVCLDRATGRIRWRLPVGAAVRARLVVADPVVVVTASDGRVFAVEARTGRPRWAFRVGGAVTGGPVLFGDGLFVPTAGGEVVQVALWTGAAGWRYRLEGPVTTPLCADSTSVYASSGTSVSALSPSTGQLEWRAELGTPALGGPVRAPGCLLVDVAAGTAVIDLARRQVIRILPRGGHPFPRPVLTAGGDVLRAVDGRSVAATPLGA